MFNFWALLLAALAWQAFAAPSSNVTTPDLTPWTTLGITSGDAANFAASGVSPAEGADIIAAESALFNGTQSNKVPGAYSAATAMGLADAADGVNLKLVIVIGWRRQHVGPTWRKEGHGTVDLAMRFRDALVELCPDVWPNGEPNANQCNYATEKKLTDIYYNVGHNADVGIKIASYEMPSQLKTLFIRTLWAVFKEITDCDTSRYQLRGYGKKHEACREFANSADQIEVRLENTRGPNDKPGTYKDPHLRVNIAFNGETTEGQFDCVGTQAVIWDQVQRRMVPKFQQVYSNAAMDFDVVCVTPRVDGACKDADGRQIICRNDDRWDNRDGSDGENDSCYWHNKCATPGNCFFTLDS